MNGAPGTFGNVFAIPRLIESRCLENDGLDESLFPTDSNTDRRIPRRGHIGDTLRLDNRLQILMIQLKHNEESTVHPLQHVARKNFHTADSSFRTLHSDLPSGFHKHIPGIEFLHLKPTQMGPRQSDGFKMSFHPRDHFQEILAPNGLRTVRPRKKKAFPIQAANRRDVGSAIRNFVFGEKFANRLINFLNLRSLDFGHPTGAADMKPPLVLYHNANPLVNK